MVSGRTVVVREKHRKNGFLFEMTRSHSVAQGLAYTLRVRVPNNLVLGLWVIISIVDVLGKYMNIRYLDP